MKDKKEKKISNQEFSCDVNFREACSRANIEVTKRQASKYRRKTGKAYKLMHTN